MPLHNQHTDTEKTPIDMRLSRAWLISASTFRHVYQVQADNLTLIQFLDLYRRLPDMEHTLIH